MKIFLTWIFEILFAKNAIKAYCLAHVSTATLSFKSPLDYVFYLATINNIAAIFGFAGVLTSQRELVQVFFGWNAVQMVCRKSCACRCSSPQSFEGLCNIA